MQIKYYKLLPTDPPTNTMYGIVLNRSSAAGRHTGRYTLQVWWGSRCLMVFSSKLAG